MVTLLFLHNICYITLLDLCRLLFYFYTLLRYHLVCVFVVFTFFLYFLFSPQHSWHGWGRIFHWEISTRPKSRTVVGLCDARLKVRCRKRFQLTSITAFSAQSNHRVFKIHLVASVFNSHKLLRFQLTEITGFSKFT